VVKKNNNLRVIGAKKPKAFLQSSLQEQQEKSKSFSLPQKQSF
jgi:hypothetical protein